MQNTVAGPIPLAMKVLLLRLETVTQMETMRLESEAFINLSYFLVAPVD